MPTTNEGARNRAMILRQFDRWAWDEKGWTETTATLYSRTARAADEWLVANRNRTIFSARYDDFKAYLFQSKPTARRRNQIKWSLLAVLDYLCDEGYRTDNPCRELPTLREPKSIPKALDTDSARQVWDEAKSEEPMVAAVVACYLWGGMRRNEARHLRWDQIDLDWITVEGKGAGRREGRGKQRRIPMHPELSLALRRWRKECPDPVWVFPSPVREGHPIGETWILRHLREIGERAGIRLHPHLLRHTIATEIVERGGDIRDVQAFLGHASIQTTSIYVRVRPGRLRDAINRVDLEHSEEEEVE